MFVASVLTACYLYGAVSAKKDWFPYPQLRTAVFDVGELLSGNDRIMYSDSAYTEPTAIAYRPEQVDDVLLLLTGVREDKVNFIRIIDRSGRAILELNPDWFATWGDDEGDFPAARRPKSQPGALIHGIDMFDNGDVVFNFEHLSTVRMNLCGEVVWKLDNLGHHSAHIADDGTVWASAEDLYDKGPTPFRNHVGPLRSWTLQNIAADGTVLRSIPVIEILEKNGLQGLLTLSTLDNFATEVSGDTLHLNDIETYPSAFESQRFAAGDLLLSLRNINTVLVVDPQSLQVRYRTTGAVLRQHDPDFIGGDRISVFDNNNLLPAGGRDRQFSRIVEFSPGSDDPAVVVDGNRERSRFFTSIMGVHQRLAGGNTLVTSSGEGRALEVAEDGTLVWEYVNSLANGAAGRLTMAMALPYTVDESFVADAIASCSAGGGNDGVS